MRVRESDERVLVVETEGEEETRLLGAWLGNRLQEGDVVALVGGLGAGKTRFVQGVARGMGIQRPVTSPTFILMNVYSSPDGRTLCHVDCYRLKDAVEEGYELGLDQQLRGDAVCVVEWAERIRPLLPEDRLDVFIEVVDDNRRYVRLHARGPRAQQHLRALRERLSAEASWSKE